MSRTYLILWGLAVAILAFLVLDFWNGRNAPPFKKFERQWAADVQQLEASGKLPPSWFEVQEVELIGGTPEARTWLKQLAAPSFKKKNEGTHKLEVLIVPWIEDGRQGVMVQYNLSELISGNMTLEIGRTLILSEPRDKDPIKAIWQELSF